MRETQRTIIRALKVRPEIDPAAEVERRVRFLEDYLRVSGAAGFVLGLSGGVDSTLAGRLAQSAVERVRADGGEAVFVGMRLPYRVQHDEADAAAAVGFVSADETVTVDIAPGVDGLNEQIRLATGTPLDDFTKGNAKARHRMVAQYALAGDRGLLVIGADHAAENVTGFFTKFGDGAADVLPLSGLNSGRHVPCCASSARPGSCGGRCRRLICSTSTWAGPTRTSSACATTRSTTTFRAATSRTRRPSGSRRRGTGAATSARRRSR